MAERKKGLHKEHKDWHKGHEESLCDLCDPLVLFV